MRSISHFTNHIREKWSELASSQRNMRRKLHPMLSIGSPHMLSIGSPHMLSIGSPVFVHFTVTCFCTFLRLLNVSGASPYPLVCLAPY